jgi:DUF4097 and DUF4098 domain-containing protein YvlB
MRTLPLIALLPVALFAGQAFADECRHSEPHNLQLDFTGVKTVMFDIGPHDLTVNASRGAKGAVQGKACASNPDRLSADVGSGDVEGRDIRGQVTADVNSGDIELDTIGSLHVLSVGSGDLKARRVKGDVVVGSIGSGDVEVREVGGSVSADKIGSGDLDAHAVTGNLTVRRVGSGSVDHSGVTGRVDVPADD